MPLHYGKPARIAEQFLGSWTAQDFSCLGNTPKILPQAYRLFAENSIWIVLGGDGEKERNRERQEGKEAAWTAQKAFQRFVSLGLTRREAEIAIQVCKGMSNKEIAMELNISETTVKKHISHIFEKLGAEKRQEISERLTL